MLEPSCAAVFRSDLPDLLHGDEDAARLARQTRTLAELLVEWAPDWQPPRVDRGGRAAALPPARRAVVPPSPVHMTEPVLRHTSSVPCLAQQGFDHDVPAARSATGTLLGHDWDRPVETGSVPMSVTMPRLEDPPLLLRSFLDEDVPLIQEASAEPADPR